MNVNENPFSIIYFDRAHVNSCFFCFDNEGSEQFLSLLSAEQGFMVFLLKNMAATRSLVGILSSNNLKFLSSRTIQTSSIRAFSVCDNCFRTNGFYGRSILTKNKSNSGEIYCD